MNAKKKKEPDIAFFIKYWNRDYLVNAIFFPGAYGRWFICMWQLFEHPSMCVCLCVYFKQKCRPTFNVLGLRQTDQSSSNTRHYSAGHERPCKTWWFDNQKADIHDHILLFPPLLLSVAFLYVIHVKILGLFFQKFHRFLIIYLSNSVHLLTYFLTKKSLPSASHEPVTLTTFCASPVSSQLCINSQLPNIVWEMTVFHVVWISV